MARLEVIRGGAMDAGHDLAVQRALLARARTAGRDAVPTVHLAVLTGEAVVLGRHQRARSALVATARGEGAPRPVLLRPTGGRATLAGEGHLSVSLVLPDPSALLPPAQPAIGPEKVVNRYVRAVLGALQAQGAGAYYFGRDAVSLERRVGGRVTFALEEGGATLFHALLALERPVPLPAGLSGYPGVGGGRPDPPPATLREVLAAGSAGPPAGEPRAEGTGDAVAGTSGPSGAATLAPSALAARVEEAIVAGYVDYARVEAVDVEGPASAELHDGEGRVGAGDPELEPRDGERAATGPWGHSDLAPVACGYLEASVRLDAAGDLAAVRLLGDFMADAAAVAGLEQDLRGRPATWPEVGRAVDARLGGGSNRIVGIRYLKVIADAVVAAADWARDGERTGDA